MEGSLPTEIFELTELQNLHLPASIQVPHDLEQRLPKLSGVSFAGGVTGSDLFPTNLLNHSGSILDLAAQNVKGRIPSEIGLLTEYVMFDLIL